LGRPVDSRDVRLLLGSSGKQQGGQVASSAVSRQQSGQVASRVVRKAAA
jgi:hypothetical protein